MALATDADEEVASWIAAGTPPIYFGFGSVPVKSPADTLAMISDDSRVKIVDYLSIDVEGAELEVLRGIDFERVQVNVIGVEHTHTLSEV